MIKNEEISTKSWKKNPESTFQSYTGKKLYGKIEVLEVHFFLKKKIVCFACHEQSFFKEEKHIQKKSKVLKIKTNISWFKDSVYVMHNIKRKMLYSACYKESVQNSSFK